MCSKHIKVSKKCRCQREDKDELVKMGIHLCYKWDKPKSMVKVEDELLPAMSSRAAGI